MATQLSLCNEALDKVSEPPITDITATQIRAQALNREYLPALRYCLRTAFWNFAITRAALTVNSTAPAFGYASSFDLPQDFVRLERFNNSYSKDYNAERLFKVEGSQILTDETVANITYVKDGSLSPDTVETLPGVMDPLFQEAFTTYLAIKISPTVTNDKAATVPQLWQRFKLELSEARTYNANERKRRPVEYVSESQWRAARRVSTAG